MPSAYGSWMADVLKAQLHGKVSLACTLVHLFGLQDLHSHLRLQAVRRLSTPGGYTVEIGARDGNMMIAFVGDTGSSCVAAIYTVDEAFYPRWRLRGIPHESRFEIPAADASTWFLQ